MSPTRPTTYTGVGSRNTPPNILKLMELIGESFAHRGFKLRTGDAAGADSAFRTGAIKRLTEVNKLPVAEAKKLVEVYAPSMKTGTLGPYERKPDPDLLGRLRLIANEFHPNPNALKGYGRSLMERNALQIFGPRLDDPVDFLVGMLKPMHLRTKPTDVGGTGQAYRIAMKNNIPIFDLAPTTSEAQLNESLNKYKEKGGPDLEALSRMVEFILKRR